MKTTFFQVHVTLRRGHGVWTEIAQKLDWSKNHSTPSRLTSFARNVIFTGHVSKIANHVIGKYGVKPIIWHDMLVNFMEVRMTR